MPNPMIRIHNTETDEVIDREMTAAEFALYNAEVANYEAIMSEAQTKKIAKAAILARLGITADEATLLLS
jgi:hypothetical protein